jgi:hypothetical protein
MATTTGGTTYVTSTDLVANYPTASLALANRVDVVASGGPVLVKTAGYTITVADILSGNKFLYNSASGGTFTLPTASLVDGMVVNVAQIGAGALTVSGGTIVGTTVTTAQYQSLMFVYVASGTTWYSVAPPATPPGLKLITAQTFSAVSSLNVNNCFSATYDNYRIVCNTTLAAGSANAQIRMRLAGTDNSAASYYFTGFYAGSNGLSGVQFSGATQTVFVAGIINAGASLQVLDISSPAIASPTKYSGLYQYGSTETTGGPLNGVHNVSTAYDGFTYYPASSTMSGTVRVYGYLNS